MEDLRALMRRVWRTNHANVETIDALLDLADAQSGNLAHEEVDLEAVVLAELAMRRSRRQSCQKHGGRLDPASFGRAAAVVSF